MAKVRFLFDEDLQGVGKLIQKARTDSRDVWVIGHQPCPIKKGTPDEDWLKTASRRRLIVFRLDQDLLRADSPSYKSWRELGCRGFVLNIRQSKSSVWDQMTTLVRHWDKIENFAADRETDKSWIGRIRASGVKPA